MQYITLSAAAYSVKYSPPLKDGAQDNTAVQCITLQNYTEAGCRMTECQKRWEKRQIADWFKLVFKKYPQKRPRAS
jgi:hypothetical protein